jgi:A/G-specific adenine glycosylase
LKVRNQSNCWGIGAFGDHLYNAIFNTNAPPMKRVIPSTSTASDIAAFVDSSFSQDVITWQKEHGRHALPWQQTTDAYRVWLSEIMLQQTQVAAVIPYYQKFLTSFPNVFALANAPSEEVMAHWSGLGYYTRARNLHQCAKQVVALYDGRFPSDPDLLVQLPGIGRSTAAAIAAFSYGTRAAILDGNVKRVFARVFGIDGYPGAKPIEDAMWLRAVALLPQSNIESYTQGLMDLGATLCTRSSPSCPRCPLQQRCVAYAQNRTAELPVRKPKKQVKEKSTVMLALVHEGEILLEQRPDTGIWGGLLSLPELDGMQLMGADTAWDLAAINARASTYGEVLDAMVLTPFSHGFTHFNLQITPVQIALSKRHLHVAETGLVWMDLEKIADAPLPAPVKKFLLSLIRPDLFNVRLKSEA